LDAKWLNKMGEIFLEQSNEIHVGKVFDSKDIILKMSQKYNKNGDISWEDMGSDVSKFFRTTPTVTFMSGAVFTEPKEKKIKEKKIKKTKNNTEEEVQDLNVNFL
jgi:hypothetical protein